MIFSFYDPDTGIIKGHINCQDSVADQVRAQGHVVEGWFESGQYRVVNDQVQKIEDTGNIKSDRADILRATRDQCLGQVDRVNPVWYATLSPQQQQDLATYRQALLDIPQQPGWPIDVIWPIKPDWL
jgi:hypothetical protein